MSLLAGHGRVGGARGARAAEGGRPPPPPPLVRSSRKDDSKLDPAAKEVLERYLLDVAQDTCAIWLDPQGLLAAGTPVQRRIHSLMRGCVRSCVRACVHVCLRACGPCRPAACVCVRRAPSARFAVSHCTLPLPSPPCSIPELVKWWDGNPALARCADGGSINK